MKKFLLLIVLLVLSGCARPQGPVVEKRWEIAIKESQSVKVEILVEALDGDESFDTKQDAAADGELVVDPSALKGVAP
jgi:hypothetical protein